MEPTCLTVRAIMSLWRAAHCERWAAYLELRIPRIVISPSTPS
jgi:hypothetical protein